MEALSTSTKTEGFLIQHRFYSTVVADILKAIQGGSFGGAFVLSFCCIDYMGLALNPSKASNTNVDFKNFVATYMTQVNQNYSGYEEHLYAMRCSLVHTYGESVATKKLNFTPQFRFMTSPFDYHHLTYSNTENKFTVNLSNFVSEIIIAVELFFRNNNNSFDNLKLWSSKLYYPQGLAEWAERNLILQRGKLKYQNIHPFLETLDEEFDLIQNCSKIQLQIEAAMNNIS